MAILASDIRISELLRRNTEICVKVANIKYRKRLRRKWQLF